MYVRMPYVLINELTYLPTNPNHNLVFTPRIRLHKYADRVLKVWRHAHTELHRVCVQL